MRNKSLTKSHLHVVRRWVRWFGADKLMACAIIMTTQEPRKTLHPVKSRFKADNMAWGFLPALTSKCAEVAKVSVNDASATPLKLLTDASWTNRNWVELEWIYRWWWPDIVDSLSVAKKWFYLQPRQTRVSQSQISQAQQGIPQWLVICWWIVCSWNGITHHK